MRRTAPARAGATCRRQSRKGAMTALLERWHTFAMFAWQNDQRWMKGLRNAHERLYDTSEAMNHLGCHRLSRCLPRTVWHSVSCQET
jgi:hypothetical protein